MRNNTSLRFFVVLFISSMVLSVVSCGIKPEIKTNGKVISADSPWYNSEVIDVDLGLNPNKTVEFASPSLVGADDKYICIFVDGWYMSTDPSQPTDVIKNVTIVDRTTKQTYKTIDLCSIPEISGYPTAVIYTGGNLLVRGWYWDMDTNDYCGRYYYIDPETSSIVDTCDFEYDMNLQAYRSFDIGEYRIETMYNPAMTPVCCSLKVYAPDGIVTDIDISDPVESYYEVPIIIPLEDNMALVPVATTKGYSFFELDLATCKLTERNAKDYDWMDIDQLLNSYSSQDGGIYFTTPNGVSKLDIQNKTSEDIMDYSFSDVNRLYLTNLEIADCTEDAFLLCGQYNSNNMFTSQFVKNYAIVEFTKAETNPHAGKQILELYAADGEIDATVSDAIIKYNNESTDYYIQISDRYDAYDYMDYSGINSQDDYDSAWLDANASLSDELAIDIINGEGPDIIMNASNLGQLNNDNCLADLSPYLKDIDQDKYFTNIIESAKTGDKLYQLPISYTIEGIQTDPSYAGASGIGFTTDEYNQFLDSTLNGTDVIPSGQAMYFVKLFNNMGDTFISGDKIVLSGPEFEELAVFVKDNVFENSATWDIDPENMSVEEFYMGSNWKTAYYCICPGISGYLVKKAQITNGTAILGLPSTDGRGPMFGTGISVAVSSHAVNIDACAEFVKMLLSDDIQTELAYSDKLVLNIDAFRVACNDAIDYFNTAEGSQNIFDYSQGTYVTVLPTFTTDDIDNLENVILSCSGMSSGDSAINKILIEEMPAYFLGQKGLDDVITIIQDRAQKVLDER